MMVYQGPRNDCLNTGGMYLPLPQNPSVALDSFTAAVPRTAGLTLELFDNSQDNPRVRFFLLWLVYSSSFSVIGALSWTSSSIAETHGTCGFKALIDTDEQIINRTKPC